MDDHKVQLGVMWAAIIGVVISIVVIIVSASVASGKSDQRITNLESQSTQTVGRGEWLQFEKDIDDRLDRIEKKEDEYHARQ